MLSYLCLVGQCVSPSQVWNEDQDCKDGSDERGCYGEGTSEVCEVFQCYVCITITIRIE